MKARLKHRRKGFLRAGFLPACRRALTGPLALAYALSATLPHVTSLTHAHEDGGADHSHVVMSAHDVALERAVLALMPEGRPRGELASSRGRPRMDARSVMSGERRGVKTSVRPHGSVAQAHGARLRDADHAAHTHGHDLPNLPVPELAGRRAPAPFTGLTPPDIAPSHVPALAILAAPARAPPQG